MHVGLFEAALLVGLGLGAGVLGALVGIGGGVVIVPVLVLAFAFDIKLAVATSLVAVVATSTAAGSVWVGKGMANMRLGMTLEVATTIGGLSGGLLAALISAKILSALFGVMMGVTAVLLFRKEEADAIQSVTSTHASKEPHRKREGRLSEPGSMRGTAEVPSNGHEEPKALAGSFVDSQTGEHISYRAERLWMGSLVSLGAGLVSGMLGVGGGFIKVPAMHLGMRVPVKVSVATSNFMIGVTAISSLFVYLARGLVHPALAVPVAIGTVFGSLIGTGLSRRFSALAIKRTLAVVAILVGAQMLLRAFGAQLGK